MPRQQGLGRLIAAICALLAAASQAVLARERSFDSFASITPIYQGSADLDRGGDVRLTVLITRVGTSTSLGGGTRAGITLAYDDFDYSSTAPVAFNAVAPWNKVRRYGASFPMSAPVGEAWMLGVAPSADWFLEDGARSSDALIWGATFSAIRLFPDGNRIGLDLAAFNRIEETSIVPFLIVGWRLGDRWRLINPVPSGPTGGAGLELDYRFDAGWSLGVGAALREFRFRLADNGPVANGIGEERLVPVFPCATFSLASAMTPHAYAGVSTGGRLRVEDPLGNMLRQDDLGNAPLFGLSLIGRF